MHLFTLGTIGHLLTNMFFSFYFEVYLFTFYILLTLDSLFLLQLMLYGQSSLDITRSCTLAINNGRLNIIYIIDLTLA